MKLDKETEKNRRNAINMFLGEISIACTYYRLLFWISLIIILPTILAYFGGNLSQLTLRTLLSMLSTIGVLSGFTYIILKIPLERYERYIEGQGKRRN